MTTDEERFEKWWNEKGYNLDYSEIEGVKAAALYFMQEERESIAKIATDKAEKIRVENTYRGKVNHVAEFAATMVDDITDMIRKRGKV